MQETLVLRTFLECHLVAKGRKATEAGRWVAGVLKCPQLQTRVPVLRTTQWKELYPGDNHFT